MPSPLREGFVFEDVGYRYPGSETWALRGVNLRLRPGERLALVGGNGAGKTTLVKLLARLYDPTEGRILLDGRDLRDYDLASLRRSVGVIFQDFFRYDLRFDENIGVGEIERARATSTRRCERSPTADGETPPAMAYAAASSRRRRSRSRPRSSRGSRRVTGRCWGGASRAAWTCPGGEWQKVALARAYMRDAQVLILDEPTAALDARAEYEVFRRFAELMRGRMAVIISHRFSTVRMADRIVVLGRGPRRRGRLARRAGRARRALRRTLRAPGRGLPLRACLSSSFAGFIQNVYGKSPGSRDT